MIIKVNTLARHTESIQMDGQLYTEIKKGTRNYQDMIMTFGSLEDRPHTVMDNESTHLTRIEAEHEMLPLRRDWSHNKKLLPRQFHPLPQVR